MNFDFMFAKIMERAPHPPYSPDLTPCDFDLFDYVQSLSPEGNSPTLKSFLK
jgi:hypothetical protein